MKSVNNFLIIKLLIWSYETYHLMLNRPSTFTLRGSTHYKNTLEGRVSHPLRVACIDFLTEEVNQSGHQIRQVLSSDWLLFGGTK